MSVTGVDGEVKSETGRHVHHPSIYIYMPTMEHSEEEVEDMRK